MIASVDSQLVQVGYTIQVHISHLSTFTAVYGIGVVPLSFARVLLPFLLPLSRNKFIASTKIINNNDNLNFKKIKFSVKLLEIILTTISILEKDSL